MRTTILAYVIALGGVATIVCGLWGLYTLVRIAGLRLRDYVPTIQTIAVGFGLIGVAQALRLLLLIWDWVPAIARGSKAVVG
jgi:tetrahydromethanopterin S-methyltransferase subunit C